MGQNKNLKISIYLLFIASFIGLQANAHNKNKLGSGKFFFQGSLGLNRPSQLGGNASMDQTNNGLAVMLSAGKEFSEFISLGLELNRTYRRDINADVKTPKIAENSWSVRSYGTFLNVLLNMTMEHSLYPYIKLGLGFSFNRVGDYFRVLGPSHQSSTARIYRIPGVKQVNRSYQIGVGINFQSTDYYSFNIEYTMISRGKITTANYGTLEPSNTIFKATSVTGKLIDNVLYTGLRFNL